MIELPDIPWVALDTECSGLHFDPPENARVACVALAYCETLDSKMWSVGLPFDQGVRDKVPVFQESLDLFGVGNADPNLTAEDWQYLLDWLTDRPIVMHNAKYDLHQMRVGTREWEGRDFIDQKFWCTLQVQAILDPVESKGLDATMKRLGLGGKQGLAAVKEWLKREGFQPNRYDLVPWDIIEKYVTTDAEDTARLYCHQKDRLIPVPGVTATQELYRVRQAFDLLRALYKMERRGIGYDAERSIEAAETLEAMADEIEARMPFRVNPTAATAYFYGTLGLPLATRKKKENGVDVYKEVRTLDEQQVRIWIEQDVPFAKDFAEVTKKRRAVSMWYRGYPEYVGYDGRLRTVFRQGHVKSGRMSVERVQLQAIPKKDKDIAGVPGVRELIHPAPGKELWNLDLAQAELRVASQYSQCEKMLRMLADGTDFHSVTTIDVIKANPDEPGWKEKRDIGKRVNFSAIFMIGAAHLQDIVDKMTGVRMPIEECERIISTWRSTYPEFQREYYASMRWAERHKWVEILPGTKYSHRSYFGVRDWDNTAWNRRVQGSLAAAFGMWLGEIEKRWPGYMILTVHDSVVLEAPPDEGAQVAAEIAAFGGEMMTDLFSIEMSVDHEIWKPALVEETIGH